MQAGFSESPVIICGAHGGGTSYVTKMIRHVGFFAGNDAGYIGARKYHESRIFKSVNYAVGEAVQDREILSLESVACVEDQLQKHIAAWEAHARDALASMPAEYGRPSRLWGLRLMQWPVALLNRVAPHRQWAWPGKLWARLQKVPPGQPWGWKDPRNGATLALWKQIYPNARILLIHKQNDQRKSRSPSGAWFRDARNRGCAAYLQNPPAAAEFDDVKIAVFEEVTSSAEAFNDLLRWLGFSALSARQFQGLLHVTGFERGEQARRLQGAVLGETQSASGW